MLVHVDSSYNNALVGCFIMDRFRAKVCLFRWNILNEISDVFWGTESCQKMCQF